MSSWSSYPDDRLLIDVSLWSANLAALGSEVQRMTPYADLFHFDVSDSHFVPGLLFFPDLVAALRPLTTLPFHVHLMATDPLALVSPFVNAGADILTVHVELGPAVAPALDAIRRAGKRAGLAIGLDVAPEVLIPYFDQIDLVVMMGTRLGIKGQDLDPTTCERIRFLRQLLTQYGVRDHIRIFADGGIRQHTVPALRAAGADGIVPGSLVFGSSDLAATIATLHKRSAPLAEPERAGQP
jgi:ribulose-phosphate 3-epimerase